MREKIHVVVVVSVVVVVVDKKSPLKTIQNPGGRDRQKDHQTASW